MQQRSAAYFPHIDGLRAIAVLAVILYHLDPRALPGGFTGVDIFFVISGFVVSASVDRLPTVSAGAGLLRFYARRMRRIVPALLVCLLLSGLLSALFIPASWLSETSNRTGLWAFFGLSNWVLAATGNDYFSPRTDFNPYTHSWSLGVEEQFYLLFPLLFLAWTRAGRGRLLSLLLFAAASAASLVHAVLQAGHGTQAVAAFYLTSTRFWQLGAGVLLYQTLVLCQRFEPTRPARPGFSWRSPLLLASLLLLGHGLWAARPGQTPWIDGLWPTLGTLGLLALLQGNAGGWSGRVLGSGILVGIGRLSYSLYLWHWPVLVLLRWTVGLDSLSTRLAAVVATFVLAWLSWRWIEQPFRHGLRRPRSDGRSVACLLLALVLGAGVYAVLLKQQAHLSLSTVSRHPLDWYAYAKSLKKEFPQCRLREQLLPVAGGQAQLLERGHCAGLADSARQLFVAGDSHALAYKEMLRRIAVLDGGQVRLYGSGGCALAGMQHWQGTSAACVAYTDAVLADIQAHAVAGDVVFLPGLRIPRLADQYLLFDPAAAVRGQYSQAARAGRDAELVAAVTRLRPLAERGVHIVLEAPKPVLPAPPYRCSDWFNRHNPICARGMTIAREDIQRLRAPVLHSLQQLAAALPGASVWDPLPVLCPQARCLPQEQGRALYFDADHLSGHGNRVLLPAFQQHLRAHAAADAPP